MENTKHIDFKVNDEIENLMEQCNGTVGKTVFEGFRYVTIFCLDDTTYEETFYVEHDGTEKNFLENLMDALYNYDSIDYVKNAIDNERVTCLDDVEWYVDQAREIENNCSDLADMLSDYMEENYSSEDED